VDMRPVRSSETMPAGMLFLMSVTFRWCAKGAGQEGDLSMGSHAEEYAEWRVTNAANNTQSVDTGARRRVRGHAANRVKRGDACGRLPASRAERGQARKLLGASW